MFEFIKKIMNKIFGKKHKLLNDAAESNEKDNVKIEEDDEIDNVFDYLTQIKKSCDNYKEFDETMQEYEQKKEEWSDLKQKIENKRNQNT